MIRMLLGYVAAVFAGAGFWAWVCRHDDRVLRGQLAHLRSVNTAQRAELHVLRRACGVRSLPARTAR